MPSIVLKRAYEKPARADGFRILVDRLWPRGVSKTNLKLDAWAKQLAPSTELRQWFGHDPSKWKEFSRRYKAELRESHASDAIKQLLAEAKPARTITLVYAAKDEEHNEAIILRDLFTKLSS
jgi:uncharacterized protein YeaO (DUF488 family)